MSAVLAGIGGALYVPQVGIINPSEFAPANSIEAVIWVAVGGRGTLVGRGPRRRRWSTRPRRGSPARLPEIWLFALGGLFIVVTLFLPRGMVGPALRQHARRSAVPAVVSEEAGAAAQATP